MLEAEMLEIEHGVHKVCVKITCVSGKRNGCGIIVVVIFDLITFQSMSSST